MTRSLTNFIRFALDNLLPTIIRDSKFFMYPLFFIWFKGKNVSKLMNFKLNLEKISDEDYADYYRIYDSVATGRDSDMNDKSIQFIMDSFKDDKEKKILDVGCGNGTVLSMLKEKGYKNIVGCDIIEEMRDKDIKFVQGKITALPFEDNEFDIVMSNHCIEHIIDSNIAVQELKRVCKEKVLITTPRQRFFRYTFDLHVNFYPEKINLLSLMNFEDYKCIDFDGDWSFLGYIKK